MVLWGRAGKSWGMDLAMAITPEQGHSLGWGYSTERGSQHGVGGEGDITANSRDLAPQGTQVWKMSVGEAYHRAECLPNPGCHMSLFQLLHPLPCPCPNSSKCCHVSVPAASSASVPVPTLSSTDKCPYPNTSIHSCVPAPTPPPGCVPVPSKHGPTAVPVAATSPCPGAVTCGLGGCHGYITASASSCLLARGSRSGGGILLHLSP